MAYPAKTWAKVKADYETGNYSVEQLWKKYGMSAISIEKRIGIDKKNGNPWEKGKLKPIIEKQIEESVMEKLTRLGMPEDKVLMVMVEGLEATYEKWKKNPNYKKDAVDETGEKILEYDLEIYSDHQIRAKFFDMYCKIGGKYVERVKVSGDEENPLKVEVITRKIIKGK